MFKPDISEDPFANDVELNKRYMNKAEAERERLKQDEEAASESYKVFEDGDKEQPKTKQARSPYKSEPARKPSPSLMSQPNVAKVARTAKKCKIKLPKSARILLVNASWGVAFIELCCCNTMLIWAFLNLLVGLAAVYFNNKGKTSAANMLAILCLVSGIIAIFVGGLNPSAVASQFFTLK